MADKSLFEVRFWFQVAPSVISESTAVESSYPIPPLSHLQLP